MTIRRRTFIGSLLATSVAPLGATNAIARDQHVVVVGAGAFGGWAALALLRAGANVTLVDAWGPGHSRSSSGGETRAIRHDYGKVMYIDMVKRSLQLWRQASDNWGQPLLHVSGVLHMRRADASASVDGSDLQLTETNVPHEKLDHDELVKRYPQINMSGIEGAIYEPTAGYLLARRACQAVVDTFSSEGGQYRTARVRPGPLSGNRMNYIVTSDGEMLAADQFVFACGPWLKSMFPDVLGRYLSISRQEVFFFGTPADDHRYDAGVMPVWSDMGAEFWYGIPGGEHRGFKVADDAFGPEHDPSSAERTVSATGLRDAAEYVAYRFPGLQGAPLIESRVCQYTNTPDGDFIADRHPHADNAWLVGGGSGHGFKHGPAMGELVAAQVLGEIPVGKNFALSRFER